MNSPKTLHPQFLPAEADSIFPMAKRFYTLHDHIRNGMVREIKVIANRGIQSLGVDSASVTIKPLLEGVFGLTNILDIANPARNEINHIRCFACDLPIGPMGCVRGVSRKGVSFPDMVLANNTFGIALEGAMLNGR